MTSSRLLLDTHAWVWLALGNEKMKKGPAKSLIEKSFKDRALCISAISLWEISMLEAKGRLTLTEPILDWIELSIQRLGLEVLPLSADVAVESSRLPGGFHGDPADRIIVATARKNRLQLVTQDELILSYAKQGLVRALACY
ncbi:hypothetical protein AZI86_10895 [Bdellovibrio bacteriovorus]|uniref:PIN domain-containing protein n=1 Tax=Bdellovibrio bacteriovorus TaxID=959 RepID=A0A150WL51_BDEBC|nr:type II toxin-antitoxin system VapC family toxin [Bdellovibrio bacteriovorus]KYG64710.1 hypothetical protein AZI86_10895 [Bdellovibrio bacteriovorus]